MYKTILTAALLVGTTFVAHADTNVWTNTAGYSRSDYELHADSRYCRHQTGPDLNGVPTSAAMKRCMRAQGWRFDHTRLEPWTWRHAYGYGRGYRHGYGYGYGYPSTARQD